MYLNKYVIYRWYIGDIYMVYREYITGNIGWTKVKHGLNQEDSVSVHRRMHGGLVRMPDLTKEGIPEKGRCIWNEIPHGNQVCFRYNRQGGFLSANRSRKSIQPTLMELFALHFKQNPRKQKEYKPLNHWLPVGSMSYSIAFNRQLAACLGWCRSVLFYFEVFYINR